MRYFDNKTAIERNKNEHACLHNHQIKRIAIKCGSITPTAALFVL